MKQAINSLLMGVLMVLIVETSPQRKGWKSFFEYQYGEKEGIVEIRYLPRTENLLLMIFMFKKMLSVSLLPLALDFMITEWLEIVLFHSHLIWEDGRI